MAGISERGRYLKIARVIYNVLSALIIVILATLAILLIGVRAFGFTPYAVLSGSMEPDYSVGSAVYVKSVEAEDIEVGDVITFTMSGSSTVVTHQVIEIDEDGLFYTQGLANEALDGSPVTIDNVIGKVIFCIPYMGYISVYVTTPPWIYMIVAAVLIWIIIMYMIDVLREEEDEEGIREQENVCLETQVDSTESQLTEAQQRRIEKREKNAKRKLRRKAAAERRKVKRF